MATSKKQQAAIAMSMKAAGKKPKMKMGGSFEKLAPPYDKATYADKIAGATMKKGGMVKKSSKKK
jgi:hypothetical protein